MVQWVNPIFGKNRKNIRITSLIPAYFVTKNNIILVMVVYKASWCSGYVTGIMAAFITNSSASVCGTDENIFLSLLFLFSVYLL